MHIEPGEPVNLFYLMVVFYHKQEENACFFYKLKYLSKFQFILSLLFLFPNRFLQSICRLYSIYHNAQEGHTTVHRYGQAKICFNQHALDDLIVELQKGYYTATVQP